LLPIRSAAAIPSEVAASSSTDTLKAATEPVATVDGAVISESEIAGATAQGIDRAVAVDRYIQRVLAANLARKTYAADAEAAIRGAERDVLAQLFVQRRTDEIKQALNDKDVSEFYAKNVKAEDFAKYRVRYFLTQDPKEAEAVAASVAAGKTKDVESRFQPAKTGDGLTTAAELPYGLGQVVRTMKVGEYSRPLMLRNGVFVLRLDDKQAGQKPELDKVSAEIRDLLVAQKLSDELSAARRSARIELK
jgi:hypothetical protein